MKPLILLFIAGVSCFQMYGQVRTGDNISVTQTVNSDFYIAGGTITISAPIHGDLIVAGGTVIVNDSVTQDILIAGGNITLNGFVGDDVRCGGGIVQVSAPISGDLIVTGGQVHINKPTIVSGQLLSSGGEVTLDGLVKGNVKDASGSFILNGTVEKDLECRGGKIMINGSVNGNSIMAANTIQLGSDARFKGNVRYWDKMGPFDFKNALVGGTATYDAGLEIENGKWHYLGFASFIMVLWYLGTALVMIALLEYFFSRTFKNAANTIKDTSLRSLGLGLLFLIGVPLAIVVLFVTIVGVPLALLTLVTYVTILLLGTVIVSLLIANWINNTYYQASWQNARIVIAAFGIFIFLKLASLTPFVGPLIMMLLVCMAFGGLLQNISWRRNNKLALS